MKSKKRVRVHLTQSEIIQKLREEVERTGDLILENLSRGVNTSRRIRDRHQKALEELKTYGVDSAMPFSVVES